MSNSIRINISFCNTISDIELYNYVQTKRSKSIFIKELLYKELLKEQKEKSNSV